MLIMFDNPPSCFTSFQYATFSLLFLVKMPILSRSILLYFLPNSTKMPALSRFLRNSRASPCCLSRNRAKPGVASQQIVVWNSETSSTGSLRSPFRTCFAVHCANMLLVPRSVVFYGNFVPSEHSLTRHSQHVCGGTTFPRIGHKWPPPPLLVVC